MNNNFKSYNLARFYSEGTATLERVYVKFQGEAAARSRYVLKCYEKDENSGSLVLFYLKFYNTLEEANRAAESLGYVIVGAEY